MLVPLVKVPGCSTKKQVAGTAGFIVALLDTANLENKLKKMYPGMYDDFDFSILLDNGTLEHIQSLIAADEEDLLQQLLVHHGCQHLEDRHASADSLGSKPGHVLTSPLAADAMSLLSATSQGAPVQVVAPSVPEVAALPLASSVGGTSIGEGPCTPTGEGPCTAFIQLPARHGPTTVPPPWIPWSRRSKKSLTRMSEPD